MKLNLLKLEENLACSMKMIHEFAEVNVFAVYVLNVLINCYVNFMYLSVSYLIVISSKYHVVNVSCRVSRVLFTSNVILYI